jgi:hypothetical protein
MHAAQRRHPEIDEAFGGGSPNCSFPRSSLGQASELDDNGDPRLALAYALERRWRWQMPDISDDEVYSCR